MRGLDPGFRAAIESHTKLHGEYELLCGVRSMDDPAVAVLREFPQVRVIECHTVTPNQKVGVLMDLAREAKHPILIVNDADIRVEPDYLARVTAPLSDSQNGNVGLVTCLYRPEASSFAGRFEGLGVATEFAPSALVARLVGVEEFAMGSTLAFRRADLERIGGFAAISEYLADDYQLGAKAAPAGIEVRPERRDRGDAFGGNVARRVVAPGALGSNDSGIEIFRLSGIAGNVRDGVGCRGFVHRRVACRPGGAGRADADGARLRMDGDAQPRRVAAVVPDPAARSVWSSRVGRGAVRKYGGLARADAASK